ncbi:LysR family transcriptional regulator [Paramixta manurensis]|uniref:LysR family transcriptional regulator n=1 Tax=Paramixta manurensis TaxID=2740817 RepID=A0A6M8UBQ2_9GAMM|nr:LysR family transcriptional regulator [Erwiniaceae bacterium PD-1]
MKTRFVGKHYRQPLAGWPSVEDLYVFIIVARHGGFARAAAELGLSPSYVSKRIAILEKCLDTRLFFRNNRMIRLTPEGESALDGALQVVGGMDDFVSHLEGVRGALTGNITLSCSFGFGHEYVADALSAFINLHPDVNVKLLLSDKEVDLVEEGVDIEIHIGNDVKDLYIARQLMKNQRILCAAPEYLKRKGVPQSLDDLADHDCLIIQERSAVFGHWLLTNGEEQVHCQLNSRHASNSGSVVLAWALRGHGIALRSRWDVANHLQSGDLVQVLPAWYQEANIWAVYPRRPSSSSRVKACIDFLTDYFSQHWPAT